MAPHTEEQSIPTIPDSVPGDVAARLVALFNAALAMKPWTITIAESDQPGAGAVLLAWARSRSLRVIERHIVTTRSSYANLSVHLVEDSSGHCIDVMHYRDLTAEEVDAAARGFREYQSTSFGSREIVL